MNKLHYALSDEAITVETIREVVNQLKKDGISIDGVQRSYAENWESNMNQYTKWYYMTIFTEDNITSKYFMDTMFENTSLDMSGRFHFYNTEDELQWLET